MIYRTLPYLLLLSTSTNASPIPQEQAIILPWQTPGVDADQYAPVAASFEKLRQQLASDLLTRVDTLSKQMEAAQLPLTINQRTTASRILMGPPKLPHNKEKVITPIYCHIGEQHLIAISFTDRSNRLLQTFHALIPPPQWQTPKAAAPGMTATFTKLIPQLTKSPRSPSSSPLKLSTSLSYDPRSPRTGSNHCLNLLLQEHLTKKFQVIGTFGLNDFSFLKLNIPKWPKMLRPNRHLTISWQLKLPLKLPYNLPFRYRWSESVFTQRLAPEQLEPFNLRIQNNQLLGTPPPGLQDILTKTAQMLIPEHRPMVAKVWGAWGYLDKGRAYGLLIGDRLIAGRGPEMIKGHIVGYYGPKLRLKSPRGYSIQEGAIVYIRKNQKKLQIGQEFEYDPTTFPTKWPPVATPEGY